MLNFGLKILNSYMSEDQIFHGGWLKTKLSYIKDFCEQLYNQPKPLFELVHKILVTTLNCKSFYLNK